jgi:hypothetical protein
MIPSSDSNGVLIGYSWFARRRRSGLSTPVPAKGAAEPYRVYLNGRIGRAASAMMFLAMDWTVGDVRTVTFPVAMAY